MIVCSAAEQCGERLPEAHEHESNSNGDDKNLHDPAHGEHPHSTEQAADQAGEIEYNHDRAENHYTDRESGR